MSRLQWTTAVGVASLALAWLSDAASAAPSETAFRCPAPGTVIVTTVGRTIALRDGPGMRCFGKTNGAEVATIAHMIAADDEHADQLRREIGKIWPLAVGNTTEFYVGLPGAPIVNRVTVVSKTAIDIGAGHFDTYVIEWKHFAATCGIMIDDVFRYYYEPRIAAVIKFEQDSEYAGSRMADAVAWEATEIAVPGQEVRPMLSARTLPLPRSTKKDLALVQP
jgi:hypothetical protein